METDDLISILSKDNRESVNFDAALWQAMFAATLFDLIAFFSIVGFREDIGAVSASAQFLSRTAIAVATVLTASNLLFRISRPGATLRPAYVALILPAVLMVVAVAMDVAGPSNDWRSDFIGNMRLCLAIIPLFSLAPLACVLYVLKLGAPDNSGAAGAVAGLVAAGIGATFNAVGCDHESPVFLLIWYPVSLGLIATLGWFAGRKVLVW